MNKVLIFFAEGLEEIEGLTVVDLLRRADIPVDIVSVTGDKTVTGSHGIKIIADLTLDEAISDKAVFADAAMMVLPGGMPGTKNLEGCEPLMEKLEEFYQAGLKGDGKYIAAICAAPSIFAHKGYLKGRKACCHPSVEGELKEGEATVLTNPANGDEFIITSRGMGTAIDFGLEIIKTFKGEEAAKTLASAIVHRM